jgi:hypothetical protein
VANPKVQFFNIYPFCKLCDKGIFAKKRLFGQPQEKRVAFCGFAAKKRILLLLR